LLSAAPASAQINSISDLLNKVRSDSAATEAANRDREAKFRQRRDQQAGLLAEARFVPHRVTLVRSLVLHVQKRVSLKRSSIVH